MTSHDLPRSPTIFHDLPCSQVRCLKTGHICEVQITLTALLHIKAGGGHAAYSLARMHKLFEPETYRHEGNLDEKAVAAVRCGLVRELVCRHDATDTFSARLVGLCSALSAPSCALRELRLVGCQWPVGHLAIEELLVALPASVSHLSISAMHTGGTLPEQAFANLAASLEECLIYSMALSGPVPRSIGQCRKLRTLILDDNALEGELPAELAGCLSLRVLKLRGNRLVGRVPAPVESMRSRLDEFVVEGNQGML